MGIFKETVKIANPKQNENFLVLEMIVDRVATYTQIPSPILFSLNIERKYKRKLKIATGEIIERDAGEILVTIKNETLTTIVIFGDKTSEALLGALTLEQFGLGIDPVNKNLIPVPELMLKMVRRDEKFFAPTLFWGLGGRLTSRRLN